MPYISVALDDAKEGEPVPEGEYELRIVKAEDGESKKGNTMTTVTMRIENAGIPNASPVRHWLVYPDSSTPMEQRNLRLLDIKRFLTCFGVPFDGGGFDSADLEGAIGRCMLTQEQNEENGEIYNRLRLPRLKE